MIHPLVDQLRFTRREFQRGFEGLSDKDARRRIEPMNCVSWMIGHLAWQEQRYLLEPRGLGLAPELNELYGYGRPALTPPLADIWTTWHAITQATNPHLDTLTSEALLGEIAFFGGEWRTNLGSLIQRIIYHYWYHIGESQAVRQMLGHTDLQDFVGDLDTEAPYRLV